MGILTDSTSVCRDTTNSSDTGIPLKEIVKYNQWCCGSVVLWFPEMAQNCTPHTTCSVCRVFLNNTHYMSQRRELQLAEADATPEQQLIQKWTKSGNSSD